MKKKRIVVTGMGVVSCFGNDVDHYYNMLLEGKSGVGPIEGFDVSQYPTRFAAEIKNFDVGDYLDKKQARRVDPFISYAMVAGKKAVESALITSEFLEKCEKSRYGIIIGSGMGGMHVFSEGDRTLLAKGHKRVSPFFIPYIITNMAGALLAIDLGFMGPNYSVSTACATSNYAIQLAARHIQNGDVDLMICGGSEAGITPIGLAGFVQCQALSERNDAPEKASRPWDEGRDGFVMGEGAGAIVLETLEHAEKRGAPILAEYLGGGFSCDAYHMTDPREDGLGVAECIHQALLEAGIDKTRVNYINAHATSTQVGDIREIEGLKAIFGDHIYNLCINATKSMIGHCLGAAGALEAIAAVKAIQTAQVHPTINIENIAPSLAEIDVVPNVAKRWDVDVALSNSFGFGGHNSCLLFGKFKR